MQFRSGMIACLFLLAAPAASAETAPQAESGCGSIHVRVQAVALPDNGGPPHSEFLDRTWDVPKGPESHYGNSPDGAIVTQGYPNNGGSHSHNFLKTNCSVEPQRPGAVTFHLEARANLNSGVGRGTGASSDYDTEWFLVANLPGISRGADPQTAKTWNIEFVGIINASNIRPTCAIRINNESRPIPAGPFYQLFEKRTGANAIFVTCSQGHIAIFPSGPRPGLFDGQVTTDVTVTFRPN